MNKKLRGMIDEIFSDMKMTADNLAIRDELMANAASRYEDALAAGKSEEEAFNEVASSLEDVRANQRQRIRKIRQSLILRMRCPRHLMPLASGHSRRMRRPARCSAASGKRSEKARLRLAG